MVHRSLFTVHSSWVTVHCSEGPMRFIADRNLGKLVKELRKLGYDTVYYRSDDLYGLMCIARQEDRTILTRNTRLRPRRPEDKVVRIIEDVPREQLRQLIKEGLLSLDRDRLLSRCLLCNDLLERIAHEEAQGRVPDYTFHQQEDFFRCPRCERIYWKGSHHENMERSIQALFGREEELV